MSSSKDSQYSEKETGRREKGESTNARSGKADSAQSHTDSISNMSGLQQRGSGPQNADTRSPDKCYGQDTASNRNRTTISGDSGDSAKQNLAQGGTPKPTLEDVKSVFKPADDASTVLFALSGVLFIAGVAFPPAAAAGAVAETMAVAGATLATPGTYLGLVTVTDRVVNEGAHPIDALAQEFVPDGLRESIVGNGSGNKALDGTERRSEPSDQMRIDPSFREDGPIVLPRY